MHFLRSAVLLALTTLLPSALALQEKQNPISPTSTDDLPPELRSMLATADRVALHAALHESHSSFTDGTHENDIAAVQAVHRESPPLATRIVELARRQVSNSTTSAASHITSAPASSAAAGSSSATTLLLTTYTNPDGSVVTISSLEVVGVGAAATSKAAAGATGAAASSGSHGSLQSWGEKSAGPYEHLKLLYQAVGLIFLLGFVGIA